MSYAGLPQDEGIGASQMGGNPWMRNMMLAQMLMRGQQQPQGQNPWSSLAGAGGNVVQAMMLQRLMNQQNPNQSPGPTPQPPMASRPPTPLGAMGQPGMSPLTPSNIPLSGQNFAGGIAPFGTSGTGGIY